MRITFGDFELHVGRRVENAFNTAQFLVSALPAAAELLSNFYKQRQVVNDVVRAPIMPLESRCAFDGGCDASSGPLDEVSPDDNVLHMPPDFQWRGLASDWENPRLFVFQRCIALHSDSSRDTMLMGSLPVAVTWSEDEGKTWRWVVNGDRVKACSSMDEGKLACDLRLADLVEGGP